jgi:hypothetical protein
MNVTRLILRPTLLIIVFCAIALPSSAQNASTGALAGTVTDPSEAVIAGARITLTNQGTGEKRTATSRADGSYVISLLPPGWYQVKILSAGFRASVFKDIRVVVTETATISAKLEIGTTDQIVTVNGTQNILQTESAEMGHVAGVEQIENYPLVTRNYVQIIALDPGISKEPTNAGDLGLGSESYGAGPSGFSAHGGATNDNNFQMNGLEVNDTMGSQANSGGVPVPNPDTLEEFKVLTGQYDASYGRNAGANVNVVTKSGANEIHGDLFEYFRNDVLDANDYFFNLNGQPRPVLKQNQFGFVLGGPIKKSKVLYFGSYQGTRQRNGVSSVCSSTILLPPLTNDRSAAGLGALFAGRRGVYQVLLGNVGPAIAADGSNISPVALALLQAKNPDGTYLIPTPQRITPNPDPTQFESEGEASVSVPCPFTENQGMANLDYLQSDKSKWSEKLFIARSNDLQTLRYSKEVSTGGGVPGFPLNAVTNYLNFSLAHNYIFSSSLMNQLNLGYNRQHSAQVQIDPYTFSNFGIVAPAVDDPPVITVGDVTLGGYGQGVTFNQNTFMVQDSVAWTRGRHTLRFGGGLERVQINEPGIQFSGTNGYLSFSDLLLGLDANDNGTAAAGVPLSNVIVTLDLLGGKKAYYRIWDGNAYMQDDIKLTSRFTLNAGLRFERLGDTSQPQGLATSFDLSLANPNPPITGTLAGYTVPSNFPGAIPAGVTQTDNNLGIKGINQNTWNPRLGFAWQLPGTERLVLRGGYGVFHSRTTGQGPFQAVTAPPLSILRALAGSDNAAATASNPFPAITPTPPYFPPITPTSTLTTEVVSQDFRPPIFQRYSLGTQAQLTKDFVLDISFVGARGEHLVRERRPDQALLASPTDPIRGVTTNTVANVAQRVPFQGLSTTGFILIESEGASWYNALDVSLTKRLSRGLQFLASYTFARALTDTPGTTAANDGIGGSVLGDQTNPASNYGPDSFIREHRFVFSYIYNLPGPKNLSSLPGRLLGAWSFSGVAVAQSGHLLSMAYNNSKNAYGMSSVDRPDLVPGCAVSNSGSVESRLNAFFNASCFVAPPPLVAGNSATGFGDSPTGIIHGPRNVNVDLSLGKRFALRWPNEHSNLEFQAQFFNAFNHPQFADPATKFKSTGFDEITGTITNPRIGQLALRFNF